MSGYLLDTNVVSELNREDPHTQVVDSVADRTDTWLSSVVVHEMEYGVQLLPPGSRRERVLAAHAQFLTVFRDRILPLDRKAAELAALLRAGERRAGRTLAVPDALIAGTAMANDLTLVTRNVRDFRRLGIEIVNPWEDVLD